MVKCTDATQGDQRSTQETRAQHESMSLRLAPGQTLLGELELSTFELAESDALDWLMNMCYGNVVTVTVKPESGGAPSSSRVIVGVLNCCCPFCGTKQKALHDHWVICCEWDRRRPIADPAEALEALCDLRHSLQPKYLTEGDERPSWRRRYRFRDYHNLGHGDWAERLGIEKPERGFPYYFPGSSPIKLYQFYVENGLEALLERQKKDPEIFGNVEVLSDGKIVMGWEGPYQGLYECFSPNCNEEYFYLSNATGEDFQRLDSFKLESHVPKRLIAKSIAESNKLELTIKDPRSQSLHCYAWDLRKGSLIVDGIEVTSAEVTKGELCVVDDLNAFAHHMTNPFAEVTQCLFEYHSDIAATYNTCMNARYVPPDLPVEDLSSTFFGMIATLAIANRFRGYPFNFYTHTTSFSFKSIWSNCLAGQILPRDFGDLEGHIGDILRKMSLPDTRVLREICLSDPSILADLSAWGRFPFCEASHIEVFLSSVCGQIWLGACADPNQNLREGKHSMIFKSYLEDLVEEKGEEAAWAIVSPLLDDYSRCEKFFHRGRLCSL